MTTNRIRSRLVTGCLVALSLPAGAALAHGLITPSPDFGIIAPWELPRVSQEKATTARSSERWSSGTFVLFRTEATQPAGPNDVSPATAEPAKAPAGVPAVPVPGTVQNVRRADTH
jgi:hypothetical protein